MAAISAVTIILGPLALAAATAATAQTYEASIPDTAIAVEPGESVDIPVAIVNHDGSASPELHLVMPPPVGNYTFEQLSLPDCGPIVPSTTYSGWTESTIAPIPAGGTRTCTIRATRDAGEIDNGFIHWAVGESGSWISSRIGTFVDVAVSAMKIDAHRSPDGTTYATYRIEGQNTSTIDIENVTIQLGSVCVPSGISVETDFGGCSAGRLSCAFGGSDAPAAILPPIAAGSSASCLVRFAAQPGADLSGTAAALAPYIENAATGGLMDDDNSANDIAPIDLEPQQRGHSAHSAPRSPRR
jgi:hypothetical protein